MKNKKEKLISLRLTNELYDSCVKLALTKANQNLKIISVSEVIREILLKNLKDEKID